MQTKIRIAIAHKEYTGSYINKASSGLTTDLDTAITFKDVGEASEWLLNCRYAPVEKECYAYARIEITKRDMEVDEDERMQTSLYTGMDGRTEVTHENG